MAIKAKKWYAVRQGAEAGIFETWEECAPFVIGVTGAEYKSFLSREEAEAYMRGYDAKRAIAVKYPRLPKCDVVAYVDGSYDPSKKRASYGAVILVGGKEITLSGLCDDNDELLHMGNVAGEIKGAEAAIRWAMTHGYKSIEVVHDYLGIAKWANNEWKANRPHTQAYHQFCWEARRKIHLQFRKVKGHSGDKYNDMADMLAKKALEKV